MSGGAQGKDTDDVSGAAQPADAGSTDASHPSHEELGTSSDPALELPDPDALAPPPAQVEELSSACVRFVAARYGIALDYAPDTLSLLDQWVRDARGEGEKEEGEIQPEVLELVQSAAGAYLGEVVRREWGARWSTAGTPSEWRLMFSTVYCSFNPVGMVREALLLEQAEGWQAHFELDPGEREAVEARLEALPPADDEEFFAPSTRYDVVSIVFETLREGMRAQGLADVRFTPEDYDATRPGASPGPSPGK